jgi:TRAP-type C4-dicarboxylate transport system permease small subunit
MIDMKANQSMPRGLAICTLAVGAFAVWCVWESFHNEAIAIRVLAILFGVTALAALLGFLLIMINAVLSLFGKG